MAEWWRNEKERVGSRVQGVEMRVLGGCHVVVQGSAHQFAFGRSDGNGREQGGRAARSCRWRAEERGRKKAVGRARAAGQWQGDAVARARS